MLRELDDAEQRRKEAKDRVLARLAEIDRGDPESAHCEADEAILEFLRAVGHADVADAFDGAAARVGGFWYA